MNVRHISPSSHEHRCLLEGDQWINILNEYHHECLKALNEDFSTICKEKGINKDKYWIDVLPAVDVEDESSGACVIIESKSKKDNAAIFSSIVFFNLWKAFRRLSAIPHVHCGSGEGPATARTYSNNSLSGTKQFETTGRSANGPRYRSSSDPHINEHHSLSQEGPEVQTLHTDSSPYGHSNSVPQRPAPLNEKKVPWTDLTNRSAHAILPGCWEPVMKSKRTELFRAWKEDVAHCIRAHPDDISLPFLTNNGNLAGVVVDGPHGAQEKLTRYPFPFVWALYSPEKGKPGESSRMMEHIHRAAKERKRLEENPGERCYGPKRKEEVERSELEVHRKSERSKRNFSKRRAESQIRCSDSPLNASNRRTPSIVPKASNSTKAEQIETQGASKYPRPGEGILQGGRKEASENDFPFRMQIAGEDWGDLDEVFTLFKSEIECAVTADIQNAIRKANLPPNIPVDLKLRRSGNIIDGKTHMKLSDSNPELCNRYQKVIDQCNFPLFYETHRIAVESIEKKRFIRGFNKQLPGSLWCTLLRDNTNTCADAAREDVVAALKAAGVDTDPSNVYCRFTVSSGKSKLFCYFRDQDNGVIPRQYHKTIGISTFPNLWNLYINLANSMNVSTDDLGIDTQRIQAEVKQKRNITNVNSTQPRSALSNESGAFSSEFKRRNEDRSAAFGSSGPNSVQASRSCYSLNDERTERDNQGLEGLKNKREIQRPSGLDPECVGEAGSPINEIMNKSDAFKCSNRIAFSSIEISKSYKKKEASEKNKQKGKKQNRDDLRMSFPGNYWREVFASNELALKAAVQMDVTNAMVKAGYEGDFTINVELKVTPLLCSAVGNFSQKLSPSEYTDRYSTLHSYHYPKVWELYWTEVKKIQARGLNEKNASDFFRKEVPFSSVPRRARKSANRSPNAHRLLGGRDSQSWDREGGSNTGLLDHSDCFDLEMERISRSDSPDMGDRRLERDGSSRNGANTVPNNLRTGPQPSHSFHHDDDGYPFPYCGSHSPLGGCTNYSNAELGNPEDRRNNFTRHMFSPRMMQNSEFRQNNNNSTQHDLMRSSQVPDGKSSAADSGITARDGGDTSWRLKTEYSPSEQTRLKNKSSRQDKHESDENMRSVLHHF